MFLPGEQFPYTNTHDLNLDWIIKTLKEMSDKIDNFILNSSIQFADPIEWSDSTDYEQLTVVVYNNTGYISLKSVPAGTAITNTEYWQPIFDMSVIMDDLDELQTLIEAADADIDDLQTAVSALQEDVGELVTGLSGVADRVTSLETDNTTNKAQIQDNKDDIASLKNRTSDLETDNTNNKSNITNLQTRTTAIENTMVKNNKSKHLLYLGDSYSTYWNNQLFNEIANNMGIPYAQCHNVSVSGAAFVDQNNSFLSQVQNYAGNRNEITDILVVGGINDALLAYDSYSNVYPDTSALQTAIRNFVTYCNNNYPNAQIHFAYVGGTMATSTYYASLHPAKSQEWAFWAYTVFAAGLGVNVINSYNAIHLSPNNYDADGLHPNSQYGVPAIAQDIVASFNGRETAHNRPSILVPITASGISASGTLAGFFRIVNDIAELEIPDQYVFITAGQVIGNVEKEIATLADSGFIIRNPLYVNTTVTISGFSLGSAIQLPAMVIFRDGKVYIKVYKPGTSDWETLTAAGASSITFSGIGSIHVPIWQIN